MSVIIGSRNYIRNAVIGDNGESIQNIENDGIIIDGKKIPPCPTPMNNCTIIDNHVFIDGYEWKNSKWKKTLRALYHKYF